MKTINCPVCGAEYIERLYTPGFIHCSPFGCGTFFDPKTLEVLPVNFQGQVIINTERDK